MNVGNIVKYKNKNFQILGYAASEDGHGNKLVEIAWDNYEVSTTGYLAVPEADLELVKPHKSLKQLDELAKQGYLRRVISPDAKLVLYNYTDKCVFDKKWNKHTLNARGTVYEVETGKVVAKAFPKFFNFEELSKSKSRNLAKKTDFDVFEKIDGSMGVVYYYDGQWRINTRGSFTSDQAIKGSELLQKYNLRSILTKYTLLVEIVYPENKIIVDYGDTQELILLGVIDRDTNEELTGMALTGASAYTNMRLAKSYQFNTINELIETQASLPSSDEGFVARFKNGERVKFKSREYLKLARLLQRMTPLHFWEHMEQGKVSKDFQEKFPEEFRKEVDEIVERLQKRWKELIVEIHQELLPILEKAYQDKNPRKF